MIRPLWQMLSALRWERAGQATVLTSRIRPAQA
jgi:hypothetical protein